LSTQIEIEVIEEYYKFFSANTDKTTLVIYGGAGSGKSYAVAQWLILRSLQEDNKRFLCSRKSLPSLRISTLQLMLDLLNQLQVPYELNRSELVLKVRSNLFFFKSLDDREKIKSAEFNYAWLEEATEFDYEDFLQVKLRLRRRNSMKNQIYLTFNPININHWLKEKIVDKPSNDMAILRTTYKVNPFLSEHYAKELEHLAEQDENYYRIYTLGEWGIVMGLIYTNWEVVETIPEAFEQMAYGLDFGYNNPTALVEVRVKENNVWVRELIYQKGLTNQELISLMQKVGVQRKVPIYADPSEPERIEEIYRAGFNIHRADNRVKDGIDFVKRHKLFILTDSVNTIKELRTYKWREDKNGNILDEPVKFNDHAMDALRYALTALRHQSMGVGIRSLF
jgi:phage terminase large subunit